MSYRQVIAISQSTFKEALRNKVMYSAVFFALALIVISSLFGAVSIGAPEKVVKDFGLFSLSLGGSLVSMLTGVSLLSKELKHKTIYNILSKPLSRAHFIVGKFLGLFTTTSLVVVVMGLLLFLYAGSVEGSFDTLLFQGLYLSAVEMLVVSAIVIFFSALVVTPVLSGVFTFSFYIVGKSIETVISYAASDPELVSMVPTLKMVRFITPMGYLFNANDALIYGESLSISYLTNILLYAIVYSAACISLAIVVFERRELK